MCFFVVVKRNINRLLQYRLVLIRLQELGFDTVFSYSLGREAGVTAEQVRRDFSDFGIKGNKKGGYNIDELLSSLNKIFRKDEMQKVILVGLGNIGTALVQYKGFQRNMIHIEAAFDIDPVKYKKKLNVHVYPMDRLDAVVRKCGFKIAIIAVPGVAAQEVCDRLVDAGITGILNISPKILKAPKKVVVHNLQIGTALESLIYQANLSSS